jgi:hypothetical protein
MSETDEKKYLNRVSEVLNRTGHPRRQEVLEDLQAHLEEMAAQSDRHVSYEELVERFGSPEEYAENLAPAAGYRVQPLLRRRSFWIGGVCLVLVLVMGVQGLLQRHAIAASVREFKGRNFYAPPFFDLDRMRALQPGATADQIREAIGYPLHRSIIQGREYEVVWVYTQLPNENCPFFTEVRVITDADEMRFIRGEVLDRVYMGTPYRPFPVHVKVDRLSYARAGRERLRLNTGTQEVYVIVYGLGVASEQDLSEERLQERLREQENFVSTSWKEVPREKVHFVHIAGPRDQMTWKELNPLLEKLPPESPVFSETGPNVLFENRGAPVGCPVYDVCVFSRGVFYHYPPIYCSQNERVMESYREDQNWLIQRLLKDSDR